MGIKLSQKAHGVPMNVDVLEEVQRQMQRDIQRQEDRKLIHYLVISQIMNLLENISIGARPSKKDIVGVYSGFLEYGVKLDDWHSG